MEQVRGGQQYFDGKRLLYVYRALSKNTGLNLVKILASESLRDLTVGLACLPSQRPNAPDPRWGTKAGFSLSSISTGWYVSVKMRISQFMSTLYIRSLRKFTAKQYKNPVNPKNDSVGLR